MHELHIQHHIVGNGSYDISKENTVFWEYTREKTFCYGQLEYIISMIILFIIAVSEHLSIVLFIYHTVTIDVSPLPKVLLFS
jgi:hypothetical protein